MVFEFLKYLQPTSYFSLKKENNEYVFPEINSVTDSIFPLKRDPNFINENSSHKELAFRLINSGYIGDFERIEKVKKTPILDEYRFIRKYFSAFWVFYVLVIRIFSLNNPLKEVSCYLKTKNVKRCRYYDVPVKYEKWNGFNSVLVKENPKVSVVIPTLNRYKYLKDVLEDLEKQDYKNFDVIIIDQSEPFQKEFFENFNLDIKLVHQKEKALWLARNTAVKMSNADFLLLFDDDSRVEKDWITQHLKCLDFFNADISSGVSISLIGAKVPKDYSYFKYSEQLDTGNVLIKRKVFQKIGLFDRQYEKQRMGDGEYGLRAYLEGFINISNPYAKRLHLKVATGGLRQMGSWDGFRPTKWFDPRPIPSVLYQFRKYYGRKLTIFSILKTVPFSITPYKYKGNKRILLLAYVSLVLIWPLILFQVIRSWKQASVKLKKGAMIEYI
jgi:glycosyltransferase involved in cell wall biosynthesis